MRPIIQSRSPKSRQSPPARRDEPTVDYAPTSRLPGRPLSNRAAYSPFWCLRRVAGSVYTEPDFARDRSAPRLPVLAGNVEIERNTGVDIEREFDDDDRGDHTKG